MPRQKNTSTASRVPLADVRRPWEAVVWGAMPPPGPEGGDAALRRVLHAVVDKLGCDAASLLLPVGGRLTPALAEGAPGIPDPEASACRPQALAEEAFRSGQRAIGPMGPGDEKGSPTAACAAVWARGQALGVLQAERLPGRDPFTSQELDALTVLAHQCGAVLEIRRLADENRSKIEQFLALQRISREMTSTLDIAKLLGMVVEEALLLTNAEGALLYLLQAETERLRLEAWAGESPPPGRQSMPIGYGIAGWVARNGRPLRVSDKGSGEGAGYGSRKSQLAVPLLSEGAVVGVLAVEGHREEAFSEGHEEVLGVFAAQAAKAIEAARFFQGVRQERDFRERILGGTPNAVLALDAGRRVVWLNQSAGRLLQAGQEPVVGNPIERYLPPAALQESLQRVLTGASTLESLELGQGKGLEARHLLVSVFPLGDGDPRGAALILQDLTEKKRLDEQVQRMQRLASIGQLAAGIAHEIRNPLTGVGISLDILREERGLTDGGRGLLDDMGREIDRLEHLIRGILDFARPQPVQTRPMRVAKALEWQGTFREQCGKKGVRFYVDNGRTPKIEGDPEKLKQLFLNLALNALEATDPGGEIRIHVAPLTAGGRTWARVVVEDTGRGMDTETLAQLFNPFFTTKSEGTGLGLAISHSIVEQHGGRIEVDSSPRAGSRFTVDLPAAAPQEEK